MNVARVAWALVISLVLGVLAGAGCRERERAGTGRGAAPTGREERLRAFAKLYGYVRYFHPSDEASSVDWDRMAVHGAGRVAGMRDGEQLRPVLEELFLPVAPTLRIFGSGERAPEIALPAVTDETQTVAWQHVGYGFGSMRSAYESARTNRQREVAGAGMGFGTATVGVAADGHRGKNIRLSALVRAEVSGAGNQAQLWLRVDRPEKQVGFFDNMDDRPITGADWRRYEVRGRIDPDAVHVAFGGFLAGAGKAWLDDFRLEVEEPAGTWVNVPFENPGFEAEGEDARPWNISSPGYHYRVVADGVKQGKRAMLIEQERQVASQPLFDGGPVLGEMVTKVIGAGLSCRFPLVLPSVGGHTWGPVQRPLEPLQRALAAVDLAKLRAEDERVRIAGVVIAWNVLQHFYPYFDVVHTDWDAVLTTALRQALADRTHAEFTRTLNWLVAQIEDGHGNVRDPARVRRGWLPWRLEWIEGEVVVTAARPDTEIRPGDVVSTIGGRPVKELVRDLEVYISGSPQWRRLRALRELAEGFPGTRVEVAVQRGSETHTLRLQREEDPRALAKTGPPMRKLDGGVWYVDLDQTPWEEILPELPEIARAPGVIFDLRGYPRNNHNIIGHLLTQDDRSTAWMQVPQIARPDRERLVGYAKHAWGLERKDPHIQGRVAFITGPQAISYAESFMSFIEHYHLGAIVGQPTAGTNGNVNPFALPGGFQVVFTGMKVLKHDGSQLHHVGIRPTVPVERTIEGVRRGRDEALEAALRVVSGKS